MLLKKYRSPKIFAEQVIDLISKKENLTLLGLPGMGLTNFCSSLANKTLLSEYLPQERLDKFIIFYYDCELGEDFFEESFKSILGQYSEKNNLISQIQDVSFKDHELLIIVENFKYTYQKISKVIGLVRPLNISKFSFLVTMGESDFVDKDKASPFLSFLFQHKLRMHYLTDEEMKEFLELVAPELGVKLTPKIIQETIEFGGGIPRITKNLLRGLIRYETLDEVKRSEELLTHVQKIWYSLNKKEQKALENIWLGNPNFDYATEQEYFIAQGLITNNLKIRGNWLSLIFKDSYASSLEAKNGRIFWDKFDITSKLSEEEVKILTAMFEAKENTITRAQVAKIKWPECVNDSYSDWAIDKIMSRFRKKMSKIGLDEKVIKTVKGKGYQLQVKE